MVGLFVIIGVLLGAAVIVWIGAAKYFEKGARYVTYFDESVQGLQVDSRVKYRGVDVGSVERIGVAPDQRLVEVVVKINLEGNLETGAVSQLKAAGITGIVFVELDRRKPDDEIVFPPEGTKAPYPVIPSQPSQTKQMLSSVDRIMDRIAQVDIAGLSDQIKATSKAMEGFLAGPETENILKRLDSATAALDRGLQRIDRILADGKVESAISSLGQGLGEARQGLGEARTGIGETREGIAEIRKLVAAVGREVGHLKTAEIAGKSNRLIEEINRRTKEVATEMVSTTDDIRQAVESLRMLIEDIRANPSDLLFSRPLRDRELNP